MTTYLGLPLFLKHWRLMCSENVILTKLSYNNGCSLVCMRFLVSLQEASKVMFCLCEFGLLLEELEKWPRRNEVPLGLDYWRISWPTRAYFGICDHWELQQARNFRGRSEWLWTWYKCEKSGSRNERCQKFYFPACSVAVMLKIETRPGWTKSCSSARETNKYKKVTSK